MGGGGGGGGGVGPVVSLIINYVYAHVFWISRKRGVFPTLFVDLMENKLKSYTKWSVSWLIWNSLPPHSNYSFIHFFLNLFIYSFLGGKK